MLVRRIRACRQVVFGGNRFLATTGGRTRTLPRGRSPAPRPRAAKAHPIHDASTTTGGKQDHREVEAALRHGAASMREATEALRSIIAASSPARVSINQRAHTVASAVGETAGLVAVGLADGEKAFAQRTGLSEWFLRLFMAAAFLFVGTAAITFSDTIRAYLGSQATKAVSGVLRDEDIRNSASSTATELAESLLADPQVRKDAILFASKLVTDPSTQTAVAGLLVGLLQEATTRRQLVTLLQHPETIAGLKVLTVALLDDETVRRSLEQTLSWLLDDKAFQGAGMTSLLSVLHKTLDDAQLRDHSSEALTAVVSDGRLQRSTGDAIWNAVTWSVTPSILRSDGIPQVDPPVVDSSQADSLQPVPALVAGTTPGDPSVPSTSRSPAAQPEPAEVSSLNLELPSTMPLAAGEAEEARQPQPPAHSTNATPAAEHKPSPAADDAASPQNRGSTDAASPAAGDEIAASDAGEVATEPPPVPDIADSRSSGTADSNSEPPADSLGDEAVLVHVGGAVATSTTNPTPRAFPSALARISTSQVDGGDGQNSVPASLSFRSPLNALLQPNGGSATRPSCDGPERR